MFYWLKKTGAFAKGLGITLGHVFMSPKTISYPEKRRSSYCGVHGTPRLTQDDRGKERCVACCLCALVCPANSISIEAGEREDQAKYPRRFEIDLCRCIVCGYCVEACPKGALCMSSEFDVADYHREALLYDKNQLLTKK